jgi:hypothetical protein
MAAVDGWACAGCAARLGEARWWRGSSRWWRGSSQLAPVWSRSCGVGSWWGCADRQWRFVASQLSKMQAPKVGLACPSERRSVRAAFPAASLAYTTVVSGQPTSNRQGEAALTTVVTTAVAAVVTAVLTAVAYQQGCSARKRAWQPHSVSCSPQTRASKNILPSVMVAPASSVSCLIPHAKALTRLLAYSPMPQSAEAP